MEKKKKLAEAEVDGVLRGGYLIGKTFVFHTGANIGKIKTKKFSKLKILE